MSDYFDRLLARHTPLAPAPAPAARLRPRLPGPFERVEALRERGPSEDVPAPPAPGVSGARSGPRERGQIARIREIRTERTVVRELPAPADEREPRARPERPAAAPLRPAARAVRLPVVADGDGERHPRRTEGRGAPVSGKSDTVTVPVPAPVTARPAPARLRPAAGEATAARTDRRTASRRGGLRPGGQRVVHVQIGRLEVSAAGPAPAPNRAERAERSRTAPTVSLQDYLARGRNGERNN